MTKSPLSQYWTGSIYRKAGLFHKNIRIIKRIKMKTWGYIIICLILCLATHNASAHKVNIFAFQEGNRIICEGYFPDGSPSINSIVEIYNINDKLLLTGKTDKKGHFSFNYDSQDDIKIVLKASMGHRGEFILKMNPDDKTVDTKEIPATLKIAGDKKNQEISFITGIDEKKFTEILEKTLDKKLRPLREDIARLGDNGTGLGQIIAGFGYILGIFGIIAFLKNRK